MITPVQQKIIDRLKKGILAPEDYEEVCESREALRVHVHALRKRGYKIETDRIKNGQGRPGVYRLISTNEQQKETVS